MHEMVFTTIRIEIQLRDELKRLGRKGETYSEIINRLILEAKKSQASTKYDQDDRARISALLPSDLG
jgi:hypothetical protein